MHEFSIAESVISTAVEQCKKNGFSRVEKVRISLGSASGVMSEALLFAFDALKKETIAEEAILFIEANPLSGVCMNCLCNFTIYEPYILSCPYCQSNSFKINSGMEMNIIEIEVI